jgi:hypothetical protein
MTNVFIFRDAVVIRFSRRSSRRVGNHTSDKDNNGGIHGKHDSGGYVKAISYTLLSDTVCFLKVAF